MKIPSRTLATLVLLFFSCSSQVALTARTARFPVCLTRSVYNADYQIMADDEYEVVHHFKMYFYAYNSFKNIEIGPALTDTLKKYQGDAIHNLRFQVRSNKWPNNFMKSAAWIFTLGLAVPSYSEVDMEGDVLRLVPPKVGQQSMENF